MSDRMSVQSMHEELHQYEDFVSKQITHRASREVYRVSAIHFKESDMTIWWSYYPLSHPSISFIRLIEELNDQKWDLSKI